MDNIPHSIEAEWAVLGAVMMSDDALDEIELSHDDFYSHANRVIWTAINSLSANNKPRDMVSVMLHLQEIGSLEEIGGVDYLSAIINSCASAANIKSYAEHVKERSVKRKLMEIGSEIGRIAIGNDNSVTALDKAQTALSAIMEDSVKSGPRHIKEILSVVYDNFDSRFNNRNGLIGLSTGYIDIDKKTNGFMEGQLIIVAGRPAMGKTTLAMNICENVALCGSPAMVFSMEMGAEELVDRSFSSIGRIPFEQIRSGNIDDDSWPKITMAGGKLSSSNLIIDDSPGLTINEIRTRARKQKRKTGLSLIMVDYLQLMSGEGNNRTEEISAISRGLKKLAKELKIPVIALSQLNRGVENRVNKRPMMADLRESGAIEQDADIILFLYRDEVYNEQSPDKGLAECIFGKHRNGSLGTIGLVFNGHICRFDNFEGVLTSKTEQKKVGRKSMDDFE